MMLALVFLENGEVFLSGLIKEYNPKTHVKGVIEKILYIFDKEGSSTKEQITLEGTPKLYKYKGDIYIKMISGDREANYEVLW